VTVTAAIIGAAALLLGATWTWALQQLSVLWADRRERRAQLNAVLAELLEIRHHALVVGKTLDLVGAVEQVLSPAQRQMLGPVPPAIRAGLSAMAQHVGPGHGPLVARYDAAVTALAKVDPGLAYWLRDREIVLTGGLAFLEWARGLGASDADLARAYQGLAEMLRPELDAPILEVAKASGGIVGWFRARRLLKRNPLSDDEVAKLLEGALDRLVRSLGAAQGPPEPQGPDPKRGPK